MHGTPQHIANPLCACPAATTLPQQHRGRAAAAIQQRVQLWVICQWGSQVSTSEAGDCRLEQRVCCQAGRSKKMHERHPAKGLTATLHDSCCLAGSHGINATVALLHQQLLMLLGSQENASHFLVQLSLVVSAGS